jgi:hypothetical protein
VIACPSSSGRKNPCKFQHFQRQTDRDVRRRLDEPEAVDQPANVALPASAAANK